MQSRTKQYSFNSQLIQLLNKRSDYEQRADKPILSDI